MYAKCVGAGACDPPHLTRSYTRNNYYGNPEFDNYPAIYVSWNDVAAYCAWADSRLPTEAEWEKAASWDEKNNKKNIYPWGDKLNCQFANYSGCVGDVIMVGTNKVGQSPYGAYDMAGNVWEWVADWYDVYPGGDQNASQGFGKNTECYAAVRGAILMAMSILPIALRAIP